MLTKEVRQVSRCLECPFFEIEGMEHMMICGHPYWKTKEAYAGAIIDQNNRTGIPNKCPLRSDYVTQIRRIELATDVG